MHKRLSGADLQSALPRDDGSSGGSRDEVIRMDAWAARTNEFFRAKQRRENQGRPRG